MEKIFDVIVVGLGAHGSAAIYQLSKLGLRVGGIDQFAPPHALGSSHGQSRIIRKAYHENPLYVPLVSKAYDFWHELENESGRKFLLKTGGVILGTPDTAIVRGAKLSAETHSIPFEYLHHDAIHQKFPALKPAPGTVAVVEKDAGILFPETCIETALAQAKKNGAEIIVNMQVKAIQPKGNVVKVVTDAQTFIANKIILSAGSWISRLVPELQLPLKIERQVLFWLKDREGKNQSLLTPGRLPIYIWEYLPGRMFYGFPDLGDGIKIAMHHGGLPAEADGPLLPATDEETESVIGLAREFLTIDPVLNYSVTCKYTNTPDENFIIDFHPDHPNIVIASPCSGHGFKFASLVGKILADMATGGKVNQDISAFALSRFGIFSSR